MYHHVTPSAGLVTVSPGVFEAQMAYLARKGYRTLRADDLLSFIQGTLVLQQPSVFITFDDGYLDNYVHAYPVLKRYDLSATIFAITGWLGDGQARSLATSAPQIYCPDHNECAEAVKQNRHDDVMLRWSEIEQMMSSGSVELHSHTHTHTRWDKVESDPNVRQRRLQEDLETSRATIQTRLGAETQHLCWPQGYFDADYQVTAQMVGFNALYTTNKNVVGKGSDQTAISRIVVKDRLDSWFARQLWIYSRPTVGKLYTALKSA
jgi:peptidoglycan/xylan/chitin deacetylase (PgdA/CDA1 family)